MITQNWSKLSVLVSLNILFYFIKASVCIGYVTYSPTSRKVAGSIPN
jgi:hypothetical protein